MLKDRILPIPKPAVPFYGVLSSYEWVDEFVQITEIKAKIRQLRRKKKRIIDMNPTKKAFLEQLKKEYAEIQSRRINWLRAQIQHKLDRGKHFHLGPIECNAAAQDRLGPMLIFEDIKAAVDAIEWPRQKDCTTEAERTRMVEEMLSEISELENELLEKTSSYYIVNNAVISLDARQQFVEFWRQAQKKFSGQVNPQGLRLRESSNDEQRAYDALKIYDFINHDAPATCATHD